MDERKYESYDAKLFIILFVSTNSAVNVYFDSSIKMERRRQFSLFVGNSHYLVEKFFFFIVSNLKHAFSCISKLIFKCNILLEQQSEFHS